MKPSVTFGRSLFLLLIVFSILFPALFWGKAEPHMPLLAALVASAALLRLYGVAWKEIEGGMIKGVQAAAMPLLILASIGILIGVWMMSGTVATILSYGIRFIDPAYFAVSALFLTILVSTATGSSFTTVSTVGVALMGIATALGIDPVLTAGAVISGACFGDKMSPLSDTTNFSAAVADVPLLTHVAYMTRTTVPAILLTALFFAFQGQPGTVQLTSIALIQSELQSHFAISGYTLLPALAVILCSILRQPILPTLIAGIGSGIVIAATVQGVTSPTVWLSVMQNGYEQTFTSEIVQSIMNRGGLMSMTWSMTLILIALCLGGMLQHTGVFHALFAATLTRTKRDGSLIALAGSSSILVNGLTGEQYMSILLPGQMFREVFRQRGIAAKRLSRTLEDCGTLVNPLIPWGVSGAFFTSTLDVATLDYLPYALFLWLSPLFTFLLAWTKR
ncbi:Na+/H+ antiporter NhaC [Brevibacillus composti]|uniref:Na+/H+ antiporter NhaC n=1 Tax=Brevibacillus composti TaxID=2796470 RepID=A0A7T5JMY0_9BACL|nr:Na+/H+ antiporter NhaC [Brevibacillus composti]QQE73562.1 Na+/H+ antiporter NhaC [Brevibacillus composti]QUO40644.1 Na+/H+ antiporter NhaC [Brevibacillus composti]